MSDTSARRLGFFLRKKKSTPADKRVAIVIMVEPGFLEWQAVLLCTALHKFCKTPFAIHPYCRADRIEDLNPFTRSFLSEHTQGVQPITPEFNGEYPNGNKVYACAAPRDERFTLFLDTDMLPLREFDLSFLMRPNIAAGVQGRVNTWTNAQNEWDKVYQHAGCSGPVAFNAVGDETLAYPYLNAGLLFFAGPDLGRIWRDVSLKVDFDDNIKDKRPWLDQITLPAAISGQGAALVFLQNHWNRSCKAEVAEKNNVKILHYHTLIRIFEYGFDGHADALLQEGIGMSLEELITKLHADSVDIFKPGLQSRLEGRDSGVSRFLKNLMN